ncbi:TonB-dependent receptor [Flavitalea sp.]|nr:outer membrane beta-barrel family protein [Flavitalea sp.]
MTRILLLLSVLFIRVFSVGAQVTITGIVTDEERKIIPHVSVTILTAKDSAFIKGMLTDSTGSFTFARMPAGQYLLKISFVGYKIHWHELLINEHENLKEKPVNMILFKEQTQLDEVVVKAERKAIRYDPSKLTLQVAGNSIFKTSANVMDILRKAPGLTVNPDGSLLVTGRNIPVVFINGKPTLMSPEESLAWLNGLTPDQVATIEIIDNPSSKYDGQFKAIIDVKLKSDETLGWKGNLSSSFRQNIYSSSDNNLAISYRPGKAIYTLRVGYVFGDDFYRYTALQKLANTNYMATFTETRNKNNNLSLQLGVDYAISKNRSLELSLKTYQANRRLNAFNTLTFSEPEQKDILGISQTINLSEPGQVNYAFNTAYSQKLSQKSNLIFLGSATEVSNRLNEDIQISDQLTGKPRSYWKTLLRNDIKIRNLQADYSRISKSATIEAGLKFTFISTDNNIRYDTLSPASVFVRDSNRTNHFIYNEYVNAGYFAYGYKNEKFDFKLSLRTEHTHTLANSVTENKTIKRAYLTWLPGASAGFIITKNQRINIVFARRMTRPDFGQLNPFRFYLSPLNYRVGNPYLLPSVITSLNLSYNFRDLNIAFTAGREKDLMTRYPEYNRVTNELLYLGANLPYNDFANIQTGYNFSITKWWKTTHTLGVYYNKEQMPYLGKTYAISVFDYGLNGSQVFLLPKGITADLVYRYQSRSGNSLYLAIPAGYVDIGLQKNWAAGKLNTKLNVYDLFYTNKIKRVFREKEIIDNRLTHQWGTRRVVLTIAYSFGKASYKTKQSRTSDDEKRAGN